MSLVPGPELPLADEPFASPVLASRLGFEGKKWTIVSDEVEIAGDVVTRDVLRHPGAVAVAAVDEAGRVLLIRQYRHPVRATLWEIPAGLLDSPDEPLFEVGRRELAEEVDLGARRWDVLADFYASSGCTDERVRVYLARGLFDAEPTGFVREAEEAGGDRALLVEK